MKQTINIPDEIRDSLKEVSEEQILRLRLEGRRFVLIKTGDKLYFLTDRKKKETIKYALGNHLCSKCMMYRGTLCQKVFDAPFKTCQEQSIDAVKYSKRSEKYSFITASVESVNLADDFFIVSACRNFKKEERKEAKKETTIEKNTNKDSTEEWWDMRRRKLEESLRKRQESKN